ncbi:MAG: hypothetical protein KF900_14355, partial [Bacteroidetes bacterium]|nr:hypothetical protein [Bacteroidota bacterium]
MRKLVFFYILFCFNVKAQHIGNYVTNGSFEEYDICESFPFPKYLLKNWGSPCPDSLDPAPIWKSVCLNTVPSYGGRYQYPRSGEAYLYTLFYYKGFLSTKRMYAKNRLKATLQAGITYCVKFYVNIANPSTYAIDGFGAYFCGSEIDTINYCFVPLTYLTPQVQNPQGNIITDTLNWVAITGTFVANGTEKYLLLGNFLSDD